MGVTAFLGQHYSKFDLHEFWDLFCRGIKCGKGDPVTKGDSISGILGSGVEVADMLITCSGSRLGYLGV